MKAEDFLANLHRGIPTPATLIHNNVLDPAVEFAASRGLKLVPVHGLSRFASVARTRFGYPTADPVQLRCFAAEFATCNWAMATDGVAVLEYNPVLAQHSLCELCNGDWGGWSDTLQFRRGCGSNATRFLIFRHAGQKLRVLGTRCAGLFLHSGARNTIFVPPSCFLAGRQRQLAWSDPTAVIAEIPWFLVDADDGADGNPPTAISAMPSLASELRERRYVYEDFSL